MPPALSDYSSDFDATTEAEPQVAVASVTDKGSASEAALDGCPKAARSAASQERSNELTRTIQLPKSAAPKKRKRNLLLLGLNLQNIIAAPVEEESSNMDNDTPPTSSVPTSSYTTRSATNKASSHGPLYDQKYHPMDDVLRPSQAAKHKAKYDNSHSDPYDSESTSTEPFGAVSSDSEVESNGPATKHRKTLNRVPSRGKRRSSRQINANVLYDTNVHPQDEDLQQMEVDADLEDTSIRGSPEPTTTATDRAEANVVMIRDTDDESSAISLFESPSTSFPLVDANVSATQSNNGQRQVLTPENRGTVYTRSSPIPPRRGPPFRILQEPIAVQLSREAAGSFLPLRFDHDDKENQSQEEGQDEDEDPLRDFTVHTSADINTYEDQLPALDTPYPLDPDSAHYDGTAEIEFENEISPSRELVARAERRAERQREIDSVLGSPSPERGSARNNVANGGPSQDDIPLRRNRRRTPLAPIHLLR